MLEYNSNYSETTGGLSFFSKDKATNFNNDIANTDFFKSSKYKVKLLGSTVAKGNNGILKNCENCPPLKYLSNFWRSLEVPLINCKVESKLRWMKHCVLSELGNGNDNDNLDSNKIIFTIKDKKLYVSVANLSAKDNPKSSKLLSKGSERLVYWNE